MGYATCIQPNGEQLRMERWLYERVIQGRTSDQYAIAIVRNAVRIKIGW